MTFYDATYLPLAKSIKAKFFTADRELYNQLRKKDKEFSLLLED